MTVSAPSPHWTQRFLSFAYDRQGEAPPAMHCWAFFRYVEREQFGREIPAVPRPEGLFATMRDFRERPDTFGWQPVADRRQARSGDPVLLTCRRHPHHIGIFVDDVGPAGSVLHCYEGAGSVLHSLFHLELGEWRITGIYRPNGEGR